MPKLLLHACCGPCTLYPLERLRSGGWEARALFYNPFIQPYTELERRAEAMETVAREYGLDVIFRMDYDLEEYLRQVAFRESSRCPACYARRIEAVARLAKKSGYDAFSTTLLYSKQQKHEMIREIAENAARCYGIAFHYEDFREGWREGQERAKSLGIYRQQYCGCILSERDRFQKPQRNKTAPSPSGSTNGG